MTTDVERPTLSSVLLGVVIALCALLLLRWLALVALGFLLLLGVVRWARGLPLWPARAPRPVGPPAAPRPARVEDPTCSWCGRPGGHRGADGVPIRPRHAHAFR